ncbi:hypothetical protein HDU97_000926 [Phlyctochytrium planicorne]|nr:hypothetical protein HDU97_000926 [Phlyctochytrium planicorne]
MAGPRIENAQGKHTEHTDENLARESDEEITRSLDARIHVTVSTQCTLRNIIPVENYLLGDSSKGQGCALMDTDHFEIPKRDGTGKVSWNDAKWDVVPNTPSRKNSLLSSISYGKSSIYYCFSQGWLARDVDPPTSVDESSESLGSPYSDFKMDLAFTRKVSLNSKYWNRIDRGVMEYFLVSRNVPNPNDRELLYLQSLFQEGVTFDQVAEPVFFDGRGKSLGWANGSYWDATKGIKDFNDIPPGTRSMAIKFYTNYPYYAVGQISLMIVQKAAEFGDEAQKAANATFIIALILVLIIPIILILEDVYRKRAPVLKLLDLVHYQGPKYTRALTYTLMMALLYMIFKWLQATDDNSDYARIPVFGGISATALSKQPALKTMKTLIFISVFVAVGVIFWPIFICYAHAAGGSRLGAALGTIACLNLIILRLCLEYISASPIRGYSRRFASEVPEVFAYGCVLFYFAVNATSPAYVQNKHRKTHFKDLVYVRTLLRPVKVPSNPQPAQEEMKRSKFQKLFSFLHHRDNRPIWLRGRKDLDTVVHKLYNFMLYGRTPARMAAAIMMMCLFTYFLLLNEMFTVIDASAGLSCTIALFGDGLNQAFSTVSSLLGTFTASQSFGSTLSSTLFDLSNQIKSETSKDMEKIFRTLIFNSVVGAMTLSLAVLIFNILDFCLTFQKDIKYLRVGNYSRLEGVSEQSTSSAMQFMGIQIGFAFVGSLYLMMVSQILCFSIALFFKFKFIRDLIWRFILQNGLFFVAAIIGIALSLAQKYIAEIFFVAKLKNPYREVPSGARIEPDKKTDGEPMVTINTRFWLQRLTLYNHIDYFFLFPNLITGLLSFLGNLFKMIIGSAIFAYRLDKKTEYTIPIVAKQSSVYFSWLLQEHHHSNPVIIIFTNMLYTWVKHASVSSTSAADIPVGWGEPRPPFSSVSREEQHRRRIQQKWALIYTLVRNPYLAKFRKHVVRETYLKDYIAYTEAPVLREQEVQRIRQQIEIFKETKQALRQREVEIWSKEREAFGLKGKLAKSEMGYAGDKLNHYAQPAVYSPSYPSQVSFVPVTSPKQEQFYQQPMSASPTSTSPDKLQDFVAPASVSSVITDAVSPSSSTGFLVSTQGQGENVSKVYEMSKEKEVPARIAPPRGDSKSQLP